MADLFREVDEALREDRAKTLWQKYGSLVIAVALALVLGTAAYVFWENWQARQARAHSAALSAALATAPDDPAAAADALAAVAEDANADQAVLARLYAAGLRAEADDRESAVALYRSIAEDDSVDRLWRDLALLLAVLHGIDTGDPAALEADLGPLAADDSPWRFSARELLGLLALRQDDRERAREQFAALAEAEDAPQGVRSRAAELTALLTEGETE